MSVAILRQALTERKQIRFYHKEQITPTVVEPYTYGENSAGNVALSAWLISGNTHDRTGPRWRMYLLEDMRRVEVLVAVFHSDRKGYNPNDSRFRRIIYRVATPHSQGPD